MSSIETLFRSLACINGSFLQSNDAHMCCSSKNHGINIADAEIAFGYIRKMENLNLKNVVSTSHGKESTLMKLWICLVRKIMVFFSYFSLDSYSIDLGRYNNVNHSNAVIIATWCWSVTSLLASTTLSRIYQFEKLRNASHTVQSGCSWFSQNPIEYFTTMVGGTIDRLLRTIGWEL